MYTYVSSSWGTTSWLDHILCSSDASHCTSDIKINYDCVLSDHHPISGTININVITPYIDDGNNDVKQKVAWAKLPDSGLEYYEQLTETGFNSIIIPDGVKCIDPNCQVHNMSKTLMTCMSLFLTCFLHLVCEYHVNIMVLASDVLYQGGTST